MEKIKQILADSFKSYDNGNKFYDIWFRKNGKAYYFLFKKNLQVTNIQFAELISLIKIFAKDSNSEKIGNRLQFLSVQQFNLGIKEIISTFLISKINNTGINNIFSELAEIYSDLLRYTIVTDCFYGSCALYLPPGIDIVDNLINICAASGYIHSCGKNVFIRNMNKFDINVFYERLDENLFKRNKKIIFCVYSHEDFTEYDREYKDDLKHGLDEVKIYEEKFFMGKTSLMNLLKEIEEKYLDKLIIPLRGNFKEEHEKIIKDYKNEIDRNSTLWLIIDFSTKENTAERGNSRYYICYEQMYINENQFQIFDENKPAWKSSTTLPHNLASAMINIALANNSNIYNKDIGEIILGDPFVGTGTIWFESLKYKFIKSYASDLEVITGILIKDNLDFFTYSINDLNALKKKYIQLIKSFKFELYRKSSKDVSPTEVLEFTKFYKEELKGLLKIIQIDEKGEIIYDEKFLNTIKNYKFEKRFLLYILIRIKLKYKYTNSNNEEGKIEVPFIKEMSKLLLQIENLLNTKNQFSKKPLKLSNVLNTILYQGRYSLALSIDESLLRNMKHNFINNLRFGTDGNINKLESNFFDIIITDPPYGFNTDYSINDLASFYQLMIRKIIQSLNDNGQVLMALPDKSLSGKISPFFTHKEIVLQQFFQIAKDENKEIVEISNILPSKELFRPPFYWEADKALKRSIIHLKFKNIQRSL